VAKLGQGNRSNAGSIVTLYEWAALAEPSDPGRFLPVASQTPITNLYVAMLARMAVAVEKLGDSNGQLSDLGGLA
jgi:hypothetical protein